MGQICSEEQPRLDRSQLELLHSCSLSDVHICSLAPIIGIYGRVSTTKNMFSFHLLTFLLIDIITDLLRHLAAMFLRSPVGWSVGGVADFFVDCVADLLLVMVTDLIVDSFTLLLQFLLALHIFSFSTFCLNFVMTNTFHVLTTIFYLEEHKFLVLLLTPLHYHILTL